jgi:UDP-glucose 4-epimerase
MKILVTGAAGGIGSTISYELFCLGHEIILVDNFRNGYKENLYFDGVSFGEFFELDINSDDFHDLIDQKRPDIILHFAAVTSLPDCEVNYRECIRVNVEGTSSVLGASAKFGVKRVIFASTSAVYENTKFNPNGFNEREVCDPRLFYSLSKKMSEELCITFRENYGLDVVILRFFNVFGPKQDIHRKHPPVINYIVRELINGRSPVLHSDGSQTRDYVYISDVINLVTKTLDSDFDSSENYIFNVSSGKGISLSEIVEEIKKSNSEFKNTDVIYRESNKLWDVYPELFSGEKPLKRTIIEKETNKKSLGDNSLAKRILGWSPSSSNKESIIYTSKTIQIKYKG